MSATLHGWIAVVLLSGMMAYAIAEEITLTTYYPSPRGVYKELHITHNAFLATQEGNVGIGTMMPGEKLEVNGGIRFNPTPTGANKPVCNAEKRGTVWFEEDVAVEGGVIDRLAFCALVSGQYHWVTIAGTLSE
jgi:hypothetical protein